MVHEITDESFDAEVASSPLPCVIAFTAGWCDLCAEMMPAFERLSERLGGAAKFCTVNIDEQRKLRIKFAVASLPYIVFVSQGKKAPLFDEKVSEERLEERIRRALDGEELPTAQPL